VATVCSVILVKRFTYRGNANEEWSNRYYFTGGIPADNTAWKALTDALGAAEKALYTSATHIVRAYGYDSDDPNAHAVASVDYTALGAEIAGTHANAGPKAAGDQAVCVWWKTSRTNTRGKAIYLRKYIHDFDPATGGGDGLQAGYETALNTFATKLRDGTFLDARTLRSRTHAETIISSGHVPYATTRTLHRRGKRP
jgi:hypothetical protein